MVKLKVCGITNYEDAIAAIEVGAEFLGFNFYPPSPRYIAPVKAREIIAKLPSHIINVGVFVNDARPEDVVEKMMISGAAVAQLHGDEDEQYCRHVGASRVIKALRIGKEFDLDSLNGFPAAAFLIDAYDKKLYGGTGKTSNWEVAQEVAKNVGVFLAGGLSPENISEAVRVVQPYAVDVNSGVELSPGHKDKAKLQALRIALRA
ncbi:MAG: phosphoribosylanthranilate isomerase [Acidobacteria bacterium]|nr:phosphoribosylanthranilate isomerase [Acidobacteriota bacterium]